VEPSLRSDHDVSGFSMSDDFSRSDESTMKETESGNDSVVHSVDTRHSYLIQSVLADWKKDISREPDNGLPTLGSSEILWNNRLRVGLNNPQARSQLSTWTEKQRVTSEYNSVDQFCNEREDCGKNKISDGEDAQIILVQDQQILQTAEEFETKSLNGLDVRDEAVSETKVGTISEVVNTSSRSPTTSLMSTNDSCTHTSVSVMSSGKQKYVKSQIVEEFVQEANAKKFNSKLSNAEFPKEKHGNDLHEELKRVREQLVEAKIKLNEKEEQLVETHKMVEALKRVIFLDSSGNKKDCPKKQEQSTKDEDVSNRCQSCIQILRKIESCKKCMI